MARLLLWTNAASASAGVAFSPPRLPCSAVAAIAAVKAMGATMAAVPSHNRHH